MKSYTGCTGVAFLQCASYYEVLVIQLWWLTGCIVNICEVSLRCEWADVPSDSQLGWMICCICNNCAASLQCDTKYVSSDQCCGWMICCNHYICTASFHCASVGASSDVHLDQMICCIVHICATSLRCEWWVKKCFFRSPVWRKYLLHFTHLCGFSPLCDSRCLFRCLASLKDLLHCAQICGWPVCWKTQRTRHTWCKGVCYTFWRLELFFLTFWHWL